MKLFTDSAHCSSKHTNQCKNVGLNKFHLKRVFISVWAYANVGLAISLYIYKDYKIQFLF